MVRYRSLRGDDDAIRLRIRELAQIRRRFGYRRLHFLLKKEGLAMNQKRFRRLYREEGLHFPLFISVDLCAAPPGEGETSTRG